MSQSHKSRATGAPDKAESTEGAAQAALPSLDGQLGNEFMRSLIQEADHQLGGQGLVPQADEDPGKYHFPEGPGDKPRQQQSDKLPELRGKHAGSQWEDTPGGTAFLKGEGDQQDIDPNDVAQGQLGDCYLMAGMIATARANPEHIRRLITDNGDGTFRVTLYVRKDRYSRPTPIVKVVDARLASKRPGSPLYAQLGDKAGDQSEMWPALIEKAFAQHKGGYEAIEGANVGKGFAFAGATELLTGRPEGYHNVATMDADDILLTMAAGLEAKKAVSADSKDMSGDEALTKEANARNVYGNHAYAVRDVDLDGENADLQNPWGSHHVDDLEADLIKKFYRGIRVGG